MRGPDATVSRAAAAGRMPPLRQSARSLPFPGGRAAQRVPPAARPPQNAPPARRPPSFHLYESAKAVTPTLFREVFPALQTRPETLCR